MTAYDHLLAVDLGHRAGTPPARPYISSATRDQIRVERWLEITAPVREALVAGLESLEAGADPGQVARRVVARLVDGTYHHHRRTAAVVELLDEVMAA